MGDPDDGWRTEDELREMFNRHGFVERVASGELRAVVKQSKVRTPEWSPDPLYRQMVRYYEGDRMVAVVNQWLRFDGTLAASGRPDPKWIRVGERTYWTGKH